MKKIVSILCALAMLFTMFSSVAFAGDAVTLDVTGPETAMPGDKITFSINLKGLTEDLGSVSLRVVYNSDVLKLTSGNIKPGAALTAASGQTKFENSEKSIVGNVATVAWLASLHDNKLISKGEGSAEVATLTFTVNDGVALGTKAALVLGDDCDFTNSDSDIIAHFDEGTTVATLTIGEESGEEPPVVGANPTVSIVADAADDLGAGDEFTLNVSYSNLGAGMYAAATMVTFAVPTDYVEFVSAKPNKQFADAIIAKLIEDEEIEPEEADDYEVDFADATYEDGVVQITFMCTKDGSTIPAIDGAIDFATITFRVKDGVAAGTDIEFTPNDALMQLSATTDPTGVKFRTYYSPVTENLLVVDMTNSKVTVTKGEEASPVDAVIAKINAAKAAADALTLSSNADAITAAKGLITEAQTAFDALGAADKDLVTNAAEIETSNTKVANIEAAQPVKALVDAIPAEITEDNYTTAKAAYDAAKAAYDALEDGSKALLTAEKAKLDAAATALAAVEKLIADKAAAAAVAEKVAAIPGEISEDNLAAAKAAYDAAKAAYDALTADQKALATDSANALDQAKAAIDAVEKSVADKAAAAAVAGKVAAIPDPITKDNLDEAKAAYDTAKAAYDALTADQKVYATDSANALDQAKAAIEVIEKADSDQAAVDAVSEKVDAIPAKITESNYTAFKNAYNVAKAAYDALTDDQKALATDIKEDLDKKAKAISDYEKDVDDSKDKVELSFKASDTVTTGTDSAYTLTTKALGTYTDSYYVVVQMLKGTTPVGVIAFKVEAGDSANEIVLSKGYTAKVSVVSSLEVSENGVGEVLAGAAKEIK